MHVHTRDPFILPVVIPLLSSHKLATISRIYLHIMLGNVAHPQVGVPMGGAGAGALMPSWMELWNEWEIQTVVVASFSLQVILFFLAGIRRYSVSFVLKVLLWLVYLLADVVAMYALGHMSSSLSKQSSDKHQLVAFWAPFLLLHLGGQDTITAYALEDNELWLRHLLNMFLQVAGTGYVLYKYINAGEAAFVRAAMLVLAAGIVKFGERIWALKHASKKGSHGRRYSLTRRFCNCIRMVFALPLSEKTWWWEIKARNCFTKNKQFETEAFIVMAAHTLRDVFVKPLIIDRNEASMRGKCHEMDDLLTGHAQGYLWEDNKSKLASTEEKRQIGEVYKVIEVELALMYDMLYTKAQVIHTWYGYCTRAVSIVSCFTALVVFRKSKRDSYSTPDIVITFALLCGACALEVTSVFKAIGSTWTYAILRHRGWYWLANAIMFARYNLVIVKDGRWSDSVGQFNFISFCAHSTKRDLKGRIARLIGLRDFWDKVRCTKHAKLSPSVKEFVWGLLRGDKSDMVRIEDVTIRSGYWARRFRGFDHSKHLDWSLSFEFQKSVLIWHIATSTFLNNPAVKSKLVNKDKDMAEAVNTLSDYMMYLLIEHRDILPIKAAAKDMFEETCLCYGLGMHRLGWKRSNVVDFHHVILDYNKGGKHLKDERSDGLTATQRLKYIEELYGDLTHPSWDAHPGDAVLVKACTLAHAMLDMELELGLAHKMAIIGTVWKEMLCYAATNASDGFHARQLSNGGEFLTHILLLTKYSSAINKKPAKLYIKPDETVEASAAGQVVLNVDDEIFEIRPI